MIKEENLIQFSAERDVKDLTPIPKEIALNMTLSQLEDLKSRWWWLFAHSVECRKDTYMGAFITIIEQLGKDVFQDGGLNILHRRVDRRGLSMFLAENSPQQYQMTYQGRRVLSYADRLFVPGAKWMKDFDIIYGVALQAIKDKEDKREEQTRQQLLTTLVVD